MTGTKIIYPFHNSLFFRSVYDFEGCVTIADYTGLWPQYRVYNEDGFYIGATNASSEASWKANVRGIVKHYHKNYTRNKIARINATC